MIGNLFQSWFIIFIGLSLFFNDNQPSLLKDLSFSIILSSVLFFFYQKKLFTEAESILFFISGICLILYSNYFGMILLPDSSIPRQKIYLRVIFYLSIAYYYYLFYKQKSKKEILIYTVLVSSHIFIFRYNYTTIAILFYLVSNLFLLKKFSIYKKNFFDLFIFLIFIIATISTYKSFFYNGSNSIFGYFYLLTGILIYIYTKYLTDEESIKEIYYHNLKIYSVLIIIYFVFINIHILSNNFKTNFILNISGFHVSNIGSMICINMPILINLFFLKKDKIKYLNLFILLLSFIVLYFTHSRASTFAIILTIILILAYNTFRIKFNRNSVFLISFIIIIFIISFIGKKFLGSDVFKSDSLSIRFLIWEAFLERVTHHSILFGFGSNNEFFHTFLPTFYMKNEITNELKSYILNFKANPHAHSLYIQFFYNYGLLGILSLLSIIFLFFKFIFSKIKSEISETEIISISVLFSVIIQEFFDYTITDAITFYPMMFSIAVISRNSVNREGFKKIESIKHVQTKFSNILVFFLLFFLSLVNFNLVTSEKIKYLFKNSYIIDNFSNLKFINKEIFTKTQFDKFQKLDKLYIPINIDDKKEQFAGEVYFNFYKIDKEKLYLELAEKNFLKCIQIFSNSAVCYNRLYQISTIKENAIESEMFQKKYLENDPFRLVID